jgi:hypothetical protein
MSLSNMEEFLNQSFMLPFRSFSLQISVLAQAILLLLVTTATFTLGEITVKANLVVEIRILH